jgi:hypothetical protein
MKIYSARRPLSSYLIKCVCGNKPEELILHGYYKIVCTKCNIATTIYRPKREAYAWFNSLIRGMTEDRKIWLRQESYVRVWG